LRTKLSAAEVTAATAAAATVAASEKATTNDYSLNNTHPHQYNCLQDFRSLHHSVPQL